MYVKGSMSTAGLHKHEDELLGLLAKLKIACDVDKGKSVTFDKADGVHVIEDRYTITAWDITDNQLRNFWLTSMQMFGIHCLWIEVKGNENEYSGCITEYFPECGYKCSMYD